MPGSQNYSNRYPMQSGKVVEIVTHPLWQKQQSITRHLSILYHLDVEGICSIAAELEFASSKVRPTVHSLRAAHTHCLHDVLC